MGDPGVVVGRMMPRLRRGSFRKRNFDSPGTRLHTCAPRKQVPPPMIRNLLPVLLCAAWLLPGSARAADEKLTILSYHEVAEPGDALDKDYAVKPTMFVRQMDWLRNNGYHFVTLDDLLAD